MVGSRDATSTGPAAALAASLICASGAVAANGDLRVGSPQAFETPNPFKAIEAISVETYATMYYDQLGGIRTKDQAADYHNALAKGVDVSPDGKTITFHLRNNIHWSDGKLFTSADALWTFNALLKNKTNQLVGGVPALKSVSAPDANTFVMHLSTRDAEFLDKLAVPILPCAHLVEDPDQPDRQDQRADPDRHDGAVQLTTWEKNGTTILTRNPRYDLFRNGGKAPGGQAHPDHLLREPRLDLPRRQPGQPGLRLQRPADLGAAREDRRTTSSSSRRRAAATGKSPSTPARPRARRSAAVRARA